jgi:hypothetical protein
MDAAHAGQGVEELRFELLALVGGDGLRASEASIRASIQTTGLEPLSLL